MKQYFHYAIFPLVLILAACQTETTPQQQSSKPEIAMPDFSRLQQLKQPAPKATIATHTVEHHGQTLKDDYHWLKDCLLYTSPSPRDLSTSRMPSSA